VIDSLGSSFTFLVPSLIGGIYSAILFTTSAYGPNNTDANVQVIADRTRWSQGGMQMAGVGITIGIAAICGLIIGGLSKTMSSREASELFDDRSYIEKD
jgi:ammonia channel protein AmtB